MSEPIRILHMIGSLNVGGSQSMIINLHRAIDKNRVQFDYIIDHPGHLYYADIVKNLGGKIYFGELTFYPWSGYVQYTPDEMDFELGHKMSLEKNVGDNV